MPRQRRKDEDANTAALRQWVGEDEAFDDPTMPTAAVSGPSVIAFGEISTAVSTSAARQSLPEARKLEVPGKNGDPVPTKFDAMEGEDRKRILGQYSGDPAAPEVIPRSQRFRSISMDEDRNDPRNIPAKDGLQQKAWWKRIGWVGWFGRKPKFGQNK
jgi:hypothetical protein